MAATPSTQSMAACVCWEGGATPSSSRERDEFGKRAGTPMLKLGLQDTVGSVRLAS
jgi:hypothetical protein